MLGLDTVLVSLSQTDGSFSLYKQKMTLRPPPSPPTNPDASVLMRMIEFVITIMQQQNTALVQQNTMALQQLETARVSAETS